MILTLRQYESSISYEWRWEVGRILNEVLIGLMVVLNGITGFESTRMLRLDRMSLVLLTSLSKDILVYGSTY